MELALLALQTIKNRNRRLLLGSNGVQSESFKESHVSRTPIALSGCNVKEKFAS